MVYHIAVGVIVEHLFHQKHSYWTVLVSQLIAHKKESNLEVRSKLLLYITKDSMSSTIFMCEVERN